MAKKVKLSKRAQKGKAHTAKHSTGEARTTGRSKVVARIAKKGPKTRNMEGDTNDKLLTSTGLPAPVSPQAKSDPKLQALSAKARQLSKKSGSLTPLEMIRECSKTLQALQGHSRKVRKRLLATVYGEGRRLMADKKLYKEFIADSFWDDRQGERPKLDDQNKAVRFAIIRYLEAKTQDKNKLATRDGNAFQQLANEGVRPKDLWKAIKEHGGRDTLSKTYVASQRPDGRKQAGKPVQNPHDFEWDIPGLSIGVRAVLIGVRDGLILCKPTELEVVHSSLPNVPPDAVLLQAVTLRAKRAE